MKDNPIENGSRLWNYVPTPEEIDRECARIREGWPEARWERECPTKPVEISEVNLATQEAA